MKALQNLVSDKTTLLIDGDLYLFQACAAAEEEVDWGDDIWSLSSDLKVAKQIFDKRIRDFCERLSSSEILVCFTAGDNFRKQVLPTYKGNRVKTRKPVGYKAMLQWCYQTYPCFSQDTLEADDVMGILQSSKIAPTCIVSDDKDMKTIAGQLYRPMSDELLQNKDQEADYWFLTQCLVGDATDGYSGCPKIGPKTAEKVLGNYPSWEQVAQQYIKAGLSREEALVQSRCARILRSTDWDAEKEEVILWSPVV